VREAVPNDFFISLLGVGGWGLAAFSLVLTGCGRYRDFKLPEQAGGPSVTWRWQARPDPVMTRGAPGEWDALDVLNPSVIRQGDAYYNLFSGYDGKTWHTGLAVSGDGVTWREEGKILSPDPGTWEGSAIAANGSAVADESGILYYYQAGDNTVQIGLARSRNGHQWVKNGAPVLAAGPWESWDERGVADPYVILAGRGYYMFYLGMDRARRQRLGVAESQDGVRWYKLRGNPILNWASTERSTRWDWASRRCGPRADIIGCCTPAATGTKCGAWASGGRAMACAGRSFRRRLRASKPGIPR